MKTIILRVLAILLAGVALFMGIESLLTQSKLLSKSSALIFVLVGLVFGYFGVTGRSSLAGKKQ